MRQIYSYLLLYNKGQHGKRRKQILASKFAAQYLGSNDRLLLHRYFIGTALSSEMIFNLVPLYLANVLGVGTAIIGLIDGIAETTASLMKVYTGSLSDKLGQRKWLAVAGYALSTISKPFLFIATTWEAVLGVRFSDRLGKGIRTAPRDALVADSIDEKQRGLAFGVHRAGDTAGAFLGIGFAALIVWLTEANGIDLTRHTFQIAVLASFIPAVLGVLVLMGMAKRSPHEDQARFGSSIVGRTRHALQAFPVRRFAIHAGQLVGFIHHPSRSEPRTGHLPNHVDVDDLQLHLRFVIGSAWSVVRQDRPPQTHHRRMDRLRLGLSRFGFVENGLARVGSLCFIWNLLRRDRWRGSGAGR